MTRTSALRIFGFAAIALAVAGSLASFSVVRAGGADGAVYLIVNIALTVTGVVLLALAARRRPERNNDLRLSSETSADGTPPAE